jgi:hypothetical protein
MKTDRYTKTVLTVIALCLIWMSLGGPALLPAVGAQNAQGATEVVIWGWRDANGEVFRMPVTMPPRSTSSSTVEREREDRERARAGARLPVATP